MGKACAAPATVSERERINMPLWLKPWEGGAFFHEPGDRPGTDTEMPRGDGTKWLGCAIFAVFPLFPPRYAGLHAKTMEKIMKSPFKLGLVSLAVLASAAFAEEIPLYYGAEIIVTASRTPQPASALLNDVTVIGRDEIARAGQSSLAEILQTVPGVEVTTSGGLGATSTIMLRGANANHTLILVDGMRLGSATNGLTAIEHIPADLIERIEILRSPASGLYGADAVGGVIQIFTKSGKGVPRFNLSAGLGSNNLQTVNGGYGGEVGGTAFHVQLGHTATDGFSAANLTARFNAFNPDRDGYRNNHLSAKVEHAINSDDSIGFTALHSDGTIHFDQGPASDDLTQQVLDSYTVYSRNQFTSDWQSLLRYGYSADDSTTWGLNPSVFRTAQTMLAWQNDVRVGPGTAIAGVEYVEQKVGGSTAFGLDKRTISSLLAGYHGVFGRHLAQMNIRRDNNSQFGMQDTGSASYGYRLADAWKVSATAGKSFKAPTFNDLYLPLTDYGFGYTYQGNPDLKSEKSFSRELRVNYQQGKQAGGMTYYENHIDNLIVASNGTLTDGPANLGAANIRGVEMTYAGEMAGMKAAASLNVQSPKAEGTGLLLPRRAEKHGSVKLEHRFGTWTAGGETVFSGSRYDDAANTRKLAGYGLVNLFASYAVNKEWMVRGRVNNLFDKNYTLATGFNTPGTNLFVGLEYSAK
jgi:vitamin B12 transporter